MKALKEWIAFLAILVVVGIILTEFLLHPSLITIFGAVMLIIWSVRTALTNL
jgi:hypothetical protein